MSMIADSIIYALCNALGQGNLHLYEPRFVGNQQRYVQGYITSIYFSSVRAYFGCFEKELADQRSTILQATKDAVLMTRTTLRLFHWLMPYEDYPRAQLPVSEAIERRIVNLPSNARLA